MDQRQERHIPTTGNNDPVIAGIMAGEVIEAGAATDAATLNSDAAVGGSVGGGSGERASGTTPPSGIPAVSGSAASAGGGEGGAIGAGARRSQYRKRAFSTANSSGTIETSGSMAARGYNNGNGNPNNSGGGGYPSSRSLMAASAIGSNIMSSSAEHSIVSFGLNFNFGSTSSPSNSDDDNGGMNVGNSGGGGRDKRLKAGRAGGEKKKKKAHHHQNHRSGSDKLAAKTPGSPGNKNGAPGSPGNKGGRNNGDKVGQGGKSGSKEGKNSKSGSSGNKSKGRIDKAAKKHGGGCVKFDPTAGAPPAAATPTGEEGSGNSSASSSDSSENNDYACSGGGSSGSGNDGSSGGKSTISSLTTSSNQEWMATNESAAAAAEAQQAAACEAQAGGKGAVCGKDPSAKKKKDPTSSGKKRKKSSKSGNKAMAKGAKKAGGSAKEGKGAEGGNEDDDGYKTDEEQWGGNRCNANGSDPDAGPVATHKGSSSLLKASQGGGSMASPASKKPNGSNNDEGPPMKQARFSIDHHDPHHHRSDRHPDDEHPEAVQSADASAQPLSSLSGSDSARDSAQGAGLGVPAAVTNSSVGRTAGLSNSSSTDNNATASSSNPSGGSGNGRGVGPNSPEGRARAMLAASLENHKRKALLSQSRADNAVSFVGAPGASNAALAGAGAQGGTEPNKRKERNAREKERSCRIARQIDDLRALLSRGGVIVSKGTKSSVLAEAANYINLLQEQQVQWEMDRQALMNQMQQIGVTPDPNMGLNQPQGMLQNEIPMGPGVGTAVGGMDAQAITSQSMPLGPGSIQPQGVVGGLPGQQQPGVGGPPMNPLAQALPQNAVNAICPNDYKFIFNNSSVGMAIASLGGAFVDCNSIFCQLSEYTKEEVCAMTIFNITSRQDLQHAFDLISQMITPTLDNANNNGGGGPIDNKGGEDKSSIVLRGAMKKRSDLGLSISLIKGDHGIAKCFCVTLVRILSMEATRPDTVSIEMELPQVWSTKQQKNVGFGASPAYTSG